MGANREGSSYQAPIGMEDRMTSVTLWRRLLQIAAALLVLTVAHPSIAAEYPDRTVTVVVAYPPGGGTDVIGRVIAQQLESVLKKPFVVVNKSGASGMIGAGFVANSAPDGYTLFFAESSLLVSPHMSNNLPFELTSFTSIALVGVLPVALVSSSSFPAKTWPELIAQLKAKPGAYSYAHGGVGSIPHLSGELFQQLAGVKLVHVPYQGGGKLLGDVMSGEVPLAFISVSPILPLVKAGKLNLLAVTSPKRAPYAPDVPAIAEYFPGYATALTFYLLAPTKLPKDVQETLRTALKQVMRSKSVEETFAAQGAFITLITDDVAKEMTDESARWGRIVRDANIERR